MEAEQAAPSDGFRSPGHFATTHWTQVLQAGVEDSAASGAALEFLCRRYWYPLYAFVRASGRRHEDALDLTQEFFSQLLQKNWLAAADPARGKFRSFMLASMKHFLANQWDRSQRIKRGGRQELIPLEAMEADGWFALEPNDALTPEALYQRRWALLVVQRARERLEQEAAASGGLEKFHALEPAIGGERTDAGYDEVAARFGTTTSTVKSWVLRMRRRFGEILRQEVSQTLGAGENVDEELRHLLRLVGE